jgi:murein DD-endopeptidase MepM/ murein hydrolase activator NlpD
VKRGIARAAKGAAAVIGSGMLGLILLVTMLSDDSAAATDAPSGALQIGEGAVPAKYAGLVTDAAKCKNGQKLAPGVLAAQLRQESGFNPRAGSEKRAQGIAQFVPGTWASRRVDGDDDGDRDVWDPKDAIPSQGKMMCELLAQAAHHPEYDGSRTELALAGYNAGWGAVSRYRGIPPYDETRNYVRVIMAGVKDLTVEDGGPSATSGGWSRPVDAPLGTPYNASGSAWSSGHHSGVDFTASSGSTVRAAGPGTVVAAGDGGAYGNQVVIKHPDGMHSQYGHLSALSVHTGQTVKGGQTVGRAGATGNASGPHLHFEIRTTPGYGSDVDPLPYLRRHGVTFG